MAFNVISNITLDMKHAYSVSNIVQVNQYDTAGVIKAQLLNDGAKWSVPQSAKPVVMFKKTDNIGGFYDVTDTDPETAAVSIDTDRSIIYISLDPQTTTTATSNGKYVDMQVAFFENGLRISTFAFYMQVLPSVITSGDLLPDKNKQFTSSWIFNILSKEIADTLTVATTPDAMTEWLEEKIGASIESGAYAIDDSLTVPRFAADAEATGKMVVVSDQNPNRTANKVWVKKTPATLEIPTMEDVGEVKSALNVLEKFSMDFLENGTATDNDYYKSLATYLTNGKYYAFGITATETCKGRFSTYYLPNAAGKVEDVGEYDLTANTEFILYGYNPPSTVANVRLAKVTGSGIASVSWTLKVYEIQQKANQADLDETNRDIEALDDKIDVIDADVKDVAAELGKDAQSYSNTDFTDDKIYNANGTYTVYGGKWISTDFISCVGYTQLKYTAEAFYDSRYSIDVAFVAFFDTSKTMTSCLKSSDYTNGAQSGTAVMPAGTAYVRVAGVSNKTCSLELFASGVVKKINDIWNDVDSDLKICCIGDSLTEGVDGMSGNTPNVIAENYPYFMGEYLNADILNYGKAGTSPNTWWANLQSYGFTFDSSIDVVLIMFGTNGNMNVNTLATDVEPYDDWQDYANTGVGCYCKIIEYIMEQTSNHAQFILCTAPFNHYDDNDYYQRAKKSVETTKAIAERYLLPVIDVYYESGLNDFNGDVFRPHDNLHFSAKGYHKLGTFIGSQVKAYLSRFSLDDEYSDELPTT